MPKIKDIFGVIEEVVDSQNKIKGKGIDVIELLNPDLKNKADVAIGPMLFKKPEGGSDLGGFATKKINNDITATLTGTKDKQTAILEKNFGDDDYLYGSVSKDPSGKNFFIGGKKRFKDGGNARIPRKPGQPAGSKKHSDLYTDENPKGTIHGLKFATETDARKSVAKIKASGKPHAHKVQAAIAMEQRAGVMGKASSAGVYRNYIDSIKKSKKAQGGMIIGKGKDYIKDLI